MHLMVFKIIFKLGSKWVTPNKDQDVVDAIKKIAFINNMSNKGSTIEA